MFLAKQNLQSSENKRVKNWAYIENKFYFKKSLPLFYYTLQFCFYLEYLRRNSSLFISQNKRKRRTALKIYNKMLIFY